MGAPAISFRARAVPDMARPIAGDLRGCTLRCLVVVISTATAASGCLVGPDYRRPAVNPPTEFRGAESAAPAAASLADQRWWQLFGDETLQALIRTALERNDDVRMAA